MSNFQSEAEGLDGVSGLQSREVEPRSDSQAQGQPASVATSPVPCDFCHGTGGDCRTDTSTCSACGGTGATPPVDLWPKLNRRRGELIDRRIAGTITQGEVELLEVLQAYADEHIARVAPRPTPPVECPRCVAMRLDTLKAVQQTVTARNQLEQNKFNWREHRKVVAERDSLRDQVRRLVEGLRQIQWGNEAVDPDSGPLSPTVYNLCPLCDQSKVRGHSPDCLVGMALAEHEEPEGRGTTDAGKVK